MKKLVHILSISLLTLIGCAEVKTDPVVDSYLSGLLENRNFFKLRAELANAQSKLSEDRLLYYRMHCEQVFGNGLQSNKSADRLLSKYKSRLNDTIVAEILNVKAGNYVHSYLYKEAAEMYGILLTITSDSLTIAAYQNLQALFGTLATVKPQQMHLHKNAELKAYRNRFNHLMTPVRCGDRTDEFIFDSGANLSTVSDSCATKMGWTILESDIEVGTATDIKIRTKLAVADSLYVGDILFENVVFLVTPAEQMTFPSVNYEIHGVIGFPVFRQMGEIRVRKDGTMLIPQEPENRQLGNMFLHGLNPVVQLISGSDTLLLVMDTGAKSSELSRKYYEAHKAEVEQKGKLQTAMRGGGGGVVEVEEYKLPDFPYQIGNSHNLLPEISVNLQDYSFHKSFDGSLGQDVIMQFSEMILNFQHMYVDFE
ncbi:MAG: retroviral-like aspartic protease family protein [Prevotellaceae bacterium]|jgi:hypothetical protein|nr:retroviral-like aspartic protease family protein [Prevotellaceae bacterium]